MMQYILLIIGFILIICASDILVEAAKSIAIKLKIPKSLIVLTIVAIGTCAPELAISINGIANNNGSIALANVIGSNIVNILLVIGIASLVNPLKIQNSMIKKELSLLLLTTAMFTIIIMNGILNPYKGGMLDRLDGLFLFGLIAFFAWYIISSLKEKKYTDEKEKPKYGVVTAIIYLIAMLIIIFFSADLIVNNAIAIAGELGISQKLITMIAIVLGTALPEFILAITMARKNEHEMVIGNVIGTNIFNICIILGLPTLVFGGFEIIDFNLIDMGAVLLSAGIFYVFAKSEKVLNRDEGFLMISIFLLYYGYIIFG